MKHFIISIDTEIDTYDGYFQPEEILREDISERTGIKMDDIDIQVINNTDHD